MGNGLTEETWAVSGAGHARRLRRRSAFMRGVSRRRRMYRLSRGCWTGLGVASGFGAGPITRATSATRGDGPNSDQHREPDEHGGNVGVEEGAKAVENGAGDLRHHGRRYSRVGCDKHSRSTAHGAWIGCGTNQRKHVGNQARGTKRAIQQRAAGVGGRQERIYAVVRRRVLGHAGAAVGEHRKNRSDPWTGRDSVGRKRDERSGEHHSEECVGDTRRTGGGRDWEHHTGTGSGAVWRKNEGTM